MCLIVSVWIRMWQRQCLPLHAKIHPVAWPFKLFWVILFMPGQSWRLLSIGCFKVRLAEGSGVQGQTRQTSLHFTVRFGCGSRSKIPHIGMMHFQDQSILLKFGVRNSRVVTLDLHRFWHVGSHSLPSAALWRCLVRLQKDLLWMNSAAKKFPIFWAQESVWCLWGPRRDAVGWGTS